MMKFFKQLFGMEQTHEPVAVQPETDPLLELAITLTRRQDEHWPDADGEYKRATVYKQLVNTFPNRSRREVSRAIERALQCGE